MGGAAGRRRWRLDADEAPTELAHRADDAPRGEERHQDQDRTCHLEQEVAHSDRPLDTVISILSMTALFMIDTS